MRRVGMEVKPLIVGELNPLRGDPRFDLHPFPDNASGGRLCKLLDVSVSEYIERFDRMNLCRGRWSAKEAKSAAEDVMASRRGPVILLGRRVAVAFGLRDKPMFSTTYRNGVTLYLVPHPSGLCRTWNHESNVIQKKRVLLGKVYKSES